MLIIDKIKKLRIRLLLIAGVSLLLFFRELFRGVNLDNLNIYGILAIFIFPLCLIFVGLFLYGKKIYYKPALSLAIRIFSIFALVVLVIAVIMQIANQDEMFFRFIY